MQVISVLEAGGLEFAQDRTYFESFAINYASERVEQLFIRNNFKTIQDDFKDEKLNDLAKSISYADNLGVLSLYEKALFPSVSESDDATYNAFKQQGSAYTDQFKDSGASAVSTNNKF
jgi:myosin heavy subunit